MKVLVASDNLVTRSILQQSFARLACRVEAGTVSDAGTAVAWDPEVSVVVLDRIVRPLELARALVQREPGRPVYVIAFCRSHESGDLMQVVAGRGAFSVLPRPIDLRTLETHIRIGLRMAARPASVSDDRPESRRALVSLAALHSTAATATLSPR